MQIAATPGGFSVRHDGRDRILNRDWTSLEMRLRAGSLVPLIKLIHY